MFLELAVLNEQMYVTAMQSPGLWCLKCVSFDMHWHLISFQLLVLSLKDLVFGFSNYLAFHSTFVLREQRGNEEIDGKPAV